MSVAQRQLVCVSFVLAFACGRVGFDRVDAALDANVDAGPPSFRTRPLCGFSANAWTLTEPEPVTELNSSAGDGEVHILGDGTTLYMASHRDRGGRWAIFRTTRASPSSPFDSPVAVPELDEPGALYFHLAPLDGELRGVVSTDRAGGPGRTDIWVVERASTIDAWSFVRQVAAVNTPEHEHDPWVSPDGLRMYLTSEGRPDDLGGQTLVMAERASLDDPFGDPEILAGLDTEHNEDNPMLTSDELTIVFGSNRPGGTGDLDLYIASRLDRSAPFGSPMELTPLNSTSRDGESFIAADGCEIYLSSTRGGGDLDIYRSRVVPR